MKLTESQLKQLLTEATQNAAEMLKKDLSDKLTYEMTSTAQNMVHHHIQEWVKQEIIPEVTNRLVASKEGLLSSVAPMSDAIVQGITEGLTASLRENLSRSYNRKKIFESLFD